jgi:hypothetical protein
MGGLVLRAIASGRWEAAFREHLIRLAAAGELERKAEALPGLAAEPRYAIGARERVDRPGGA